MSRAPLQFQLESTSGQARAARMTTPHGTVMTPTFMPVGTHGALKAMTTEHARATGSQILLGNTYHLTLRPGEELVEKLGEGSSSLTPLKVGRTNQWLPTPGLRDQTCVSCTSVSIGELGR